MKRSGVTVMDVMIILVVIGLLILYGFQAIKDVKENARGYPAQATQLSENNTYEVVVQWSAEHSFLTIIRETSGKFRCFELHQIMLPGFYRAEVSNDNRGLDMKLVPLVSQSLTKVTSTSDPSAYGASK